MTDDFDLANPKDLYRLLLAFGTGNYREVRAVGENVEAIELFRGILIGGGYQQGGPPAPGMSSLYQAGDECFPEAKPFIFIAPIPDPSLWHEPPVSIEHDASNLLEPQMKPAATDNSSAADPLTSTAASPQELAAQDDPLSDAEGPELGPLEVETDPYLRAVAAIPLPSMEQTSQFAGHVLAAHSWYKHVPKYPAKTRLVFYLDSDAGKQRVNYPDGKLDFEEITDPNDCWHYSMMLTAEYLQKFGHWSFWIVRPPGAAAEAEQQASIRLANEEMTPVSDIVKQCCGCPADYLLWQPQAIIATLTRSRAFFEKTRAAIAAPQGAKVSSTSAGLKELAERLDTETRHALEAGAVLAASSDHFEVELEHWLLQLLAPPGTEFLELLHYSEILIKTLTEDLTRAIEQFPSGNRNTPVLSQGLIDLLKWSWIFALEEFRSRQIRSGHVLYALVADRGLAARIRQATREFDKISVSSLSARLRESTKELGMTE